MNKILIGSKLIIKKITDNVYSIEFKLKEIVDEYYGEEYYITLLYDEQLKNLEKEFRHEKKPQKLFAFIEKNENNNELILSYLLIDDDGDNSFRKKVLAISNNNYLDFLPVAFEVQKIIEEKKNEEEKIKQQQDKLYYHLLYMLFLSYQREKDKTLYEKWCEEFQQELSNYLYERNKEIQEYQIGRYSDYDEESQIGYLSR